VQFKSTSQREWDTEKIAHLVLNRKTSRSLIAAKAVPGTSMTKIDKSMEFQAEVEASRERPV
jgi:hypothetical protein